MARSRAPSASAVGRRWRRSHSPKLPRHNPPGPRRLPLAWWAGLFVATRPEQGGGWLFLSLDESWAQLPAPSVVNDTLRDWGVFDEGLGQERLHERYVRFQGVSFGMAPPQTWPALRRSLFEFEGHLAVRQHDVGLVSQFPYDPRVPEGTRMIPQPYAYEPERRAWLRRELQLMCETEVLERSTDVACAGGVVLVEGQKEGTQYRLCTDFRDVNALCNQSQYPLPDIP